MEEEKKELIDEEKKNTVKKTEEEKEKKPSAEAEEKSAKREEKKTEKKTEGKADTKNGEKSKAFQTFAYIVILLIYTAMIAGVSVLMFKCDSAEEGNPAEQLCKDDKHVFKSETGNICQVCGYEFVPEVKDVNKSMVAAKNGVKVRSFYYSDEANVVYRLEEGDEVTVTGEFVNSVGSKWYMTDEGYYIFSDNLKQAD